LAQPTKRSRCRLDVLRPVVLKAEHSTGTKKLVTEEKQEGVVPERRTTKKGLRPSLPEVSGSYEYIHSLQRFLKFDEPLHEPRTFEEQAG